jgi:hypothetical protein
VIEEATGLGLAVVAAACGARGKWKLNFRLMKLHDAAVSCAWNVLRRVLLAR